ncbi:hypothetical protein O3M35_006098 [Rhynocoris fuscipes]|uniref:Secreted protein n=1 Tax=Rhynocoris fuscipes TaxID=488301 RepID=A0AAW1DEP7_9HEMI
MKNLLLLLAVFAIAQATPTKLPVSPDDLQNEIEELLAPVMNELIPLKKLMVEIEQHQKVQQISALAFAEKISKVHPSCLPKEKPFIEAWDSDACYNMSSTMSVAADLAENLTTFGVQAATTLGGIFMDFINCGSINPFTAVKCMVNEFNAFKDTIDQYKPICQKFKQDIVSVFNELREEFDECLGLHKVSHANAKTLIKQSELCVKLKSIPKIQH